MAALEFAGLAAAAATFGGIWLGHVSVRAIEFRAPRLRLPAALFIAAGLALEALAVAGGRRGAGSLALTGAAGILGMTLIYDAFELRRQWRRVLKGRAPSNPANPRHAAAPREAAP